MSKYVAELNNIQKKFDTVNALNSISLNIVAGEVLGLFGHNGAGKSTLMKLILGVIKPCSGVVSVLGHCPSANDSHQYRRQFGYLPENVTFYDQLSGREVLRYFAALKGYDKAEAERLLLEVGLSDVAYRTVKTYSKGMRQRLGLAQALLGDPRLLLLDEPTVGLDPVATQDFYTTLDRLKSRGCAVILCSHVLPGVESHIDRAMILNRGQSVALGSLNQLRQMASLPIEIRVKGLSRDKIIEKLDRPLQHYFSTNLGDSHQNVTNPVINDYIKSSDDSLYQSIIVPPDAKIIVMKSLVVIPELIDIELHQPSLEALYRFYILSKKTDITSNETGITFKKTENKILDDSDTKKDSEISYGQVVNSSQ